MRFGNHHSLQGRASRRGGSKPGSGARQANDPLFTAFTGQWRAVVDFYALLALLVACTVGGGTAFPDVSSLLYVRPAAVICLILFLLTPARADWRTFRAPIIMLVLFALLMAVQLVPLPPSIWTALPGRAVYAQAVMAAGIEQPWRPWSLTPDLTMNSLASLVIPAAVLVGFAKLREDQQQASVVVLIILCAASALMGIGQFAGGGDSPLYLYRRTYEGFSVGFLSNRNHHAALLSLVFPALRIWTLMPATRTWYRSRQWLALALGVLVVPVVLATGSRAGIALMVLGIAAAFLLFPASRADEGVSRPAWQRLLPRVVLAVLAVALVALTYFFGRAASIERLISLSAIDNDQRFQFAPTVLRVIRETFPMGSGFGSFDPLFRQYEPDAILISSYFNHAHNELLELIIMAGVPGLLFLAVFLGWWGFCVATAARAGSRVTTETRLIRLGGIVTGFLLLASLVDYPLRAPLMAAVFTIGCCWLCRRRIAGMA